MSEPIEITLPENSIIRRIFEGKPADDEKATDVKEVEKTLTDEEYQEVLKGFLEQARKQAEANKPENKLRKRIALMEEHRQKACFRGLKKGFITSE